MNSINLSEIKYALTDWIETISAECSSRREPRPSAEEVDELLHSAGFLSESAGA